MIIYNNVGNKVLEIEVDDNSYRNRAVMGDHSLTLYYSLPEHVEIPVGSYCEFQGETFTLKRPENFKMKHKRLFEYTVLFDPPEANAKVWKFRNPVDGRLKFSLTAKPHEHLQMFVDNMNRRDKGWTVGECIDGVETLIAYDHDFCIDALTRMASTFKTEYEFTGKRVSLRKIEYNKSNPLPLSYGRGNGFKSGVGRSNTGDKPPTEILFVQGGTDNIDPSKYGSSVLLLPKNQTLAYDGEHFEDEDGFISKNARRYVVDEAGLSIRRDDKQLSSLAEDSLDCSEIYPKRVGTVSTVVVVDEKNNYDIVDTSIPSSLNYEECLIAGETMTVVFQTGMLAGREFEVKYYHNAVKGKAARRFEIVPADIDGQTMPNTTFAPKSGDKYAVFKCMLPTAYICDNATKTGASWDMFRAAVKHLFDNEDLKFTFTGELDGIWSKKDWVNIGGRIKLGGYIRFSDDQFQKDGVLVRITGIKDYINKPHSPVIELSNTTVSGSVSSTLNDLKSEEVIVDDLHRDAIQFTKRRFRDAKETISMLEEALLDNFTNSINPIAVQTMSMLVGDESLQFRFVNSKTSPVPVTHRIVYDNETKQLTAAAGIIQHMTLGINTVSASHKVSEYKFWDMTAYTSAVLDDGKKKYYLYAKVSKTAQTGVFTLSENAIKLEGVSGFYHLLVGVLNSEYNEERSFVTLYGFTEILPGRITTDRIVSTDGNTYFDLLKGIISGQIKFKSGSSGLYELDEWEAVNGLITQAQNTANAAVESAKNANTAVGDLNDYVDGAFADGIITEAEAKAIEKYINTVNNTKAAVEAAYNKLYTNAYLTGTAKTGLLNAKVTLMGSIENLISAINSAIADGRTTVTEKNNVDNKYATFNSAYADFNTAVEVANKAIQDKLKGYSDEYSQKFDEFIGGSFKDLKDNAVLKQTIIEGGYLKNDLIDTNNLIVKKVFSKDGKFKILDDGSMEGTSGTFSGYLKTNFHLVEESDAIYTKDSSQGQYGYKINKELNLKVDMEGESNGATIILPNEIQYIGSRVILHNGCYPPYTRTVGSIRYSSVCIDDGGQLRGTSSNSSESNLLSWTDPNKITWINGVIELIGIIEKGAYSPSLLSWKGQSNKVIPNPSNGYMYYNTEKNRNYVYWFGQWNEIPTYENNPIIWKGKLVQAPENPEKNWVYISRYDSVFIYNGIRWEDISYYVITAEKCGWSALSMSGVSIEYIHY
mgnify:CR=1 FL=1